MTVGYWHNHIIAKLVIFAYNRLRFRTCPHRVNVRIFRHNFVGDKAKIRRRAVALQGSLTQSTAKFDEKTCVNPYVDRFLYGQPFPDRSFCQMISVNAFVNSSAAQLFYVVRAD